MRCRVRTVPVVVQMLWLGLVVSGCVSDRSASVRSSPSPSMGVPSAAVQSSPVQPSTAPAPLQQSAAEQNGSLSTDDVPSTPLSSTDQGVVNDSVEQISKEGAIAKQDTGKTYISNLLLSQQAEHLVKGRFSGDLKRLAPNVPSETEDYRLEIRQADASQAVLVATAKQPGFNSYTGVAYAVVGKVPVIGICKTNVPSQTPPQAPKLVQSTVLCPEGSSQTQ